MKRSGLFLIVIICFAFALLYQGRGLAQRERAQIPPARTTQRAERTPQQVVSTQQRINRYFHNTVVPKLGTCWRGLQGKGMVQFDYSFTKTSAGRWVLEKVSTGDTSLPADQAAKALRCMQDATRGSSFATTADERNQQKFVLHWNWPVPYPANADSLKDAMFRMRPSVGGTGSATDCDGDGTEPHCIECVKGKCTDVCVGYLVCTIPAGSPETGCNMSITCASGGPFGVTGASRTMF